MKKLLLVLVLSIASFSVQAETLDDIREVLKHVETNYDATKIGDEGKSYGILQIQEVAILDVNRKYGTSYKHEDAFNIKHAERIFELYINMWTAHLYKVEGREATTEDIVRIWNGGPNGYKKEATKLYHIKYKKYKNLCNVTSMEYKENQKCLVKGKLGIVQKQYTHTMDVYMFENRKTNYGVHKSFVKFLPKVKPKINPNQLTFNYGTEVS